MAAWFLIAYLIQGVIFGVITRYVANSKGYDGGFAWGFWLGIIGLLVVGFRPNIQNEASAEYKPMYPHAIPDEKPKWECGCGAMNPDSLDYCLSCRRMRGEYKPAPTEPCPHCGAANKITNEVCFACNKPLKSEVSDETPVALNETGASADDCFAVLESLAKLHDKGILTDAEFEQKKAEVLSKI